MKRSSKSQIGARGAWMVVLVTLFLVSAAGVMSCGAGVGALGEGSPVSVDPEADPDAIRLTQDEKDWLRAHPSLRLGVNPSRPPYEFVDPMGHYSGIAADYIRLIGDRLGLGMEVQSVLSWEEALTLLRNRELDVSPALTRTPELSRFLLFTQPHIKYSVAIVTRLEHGAVEGLISFSGKNVLFVKGHAFREIALASRPDIIPIHVDTVLEGLDKVSNGEAEAIIGDLPSLSYTISEYNFVNLKIAGVAPFKMEGLSIGVRNDWPVLASILDKTLASITPEEHQEIRRRWITLRDPESIAIELSPEEQDWLAHHPVIRNAADPAWAPIEFLGENGRLSGITSEYLGRLEQLLQVKFETPWGMSWNQMMDALQDGRLDMASCVRENPQRGSFMEFTEPYFSMATVIFTRTDTHYADLPSLKGRRVAVVERYALQDLIGTEYPDILLVPVENLKDGLTLLSEGKVHAYIDALAPGSHGLNSHGFKNIHVAGETPFRYEMAMAASKREPILASILQKAMKTLPEEDRDRFFQKWASVPISYRPDYSIVWKVFSGASALLLIVITWNRRLSSEVAARGRVETDLRHAKEELEQRVKERTAELEARNMALADEVLERRRAEDALRESEKRFMQLFDSAPVPMAFASDADGYRGTSWNRAWYQTFGYPREVAEGRSGNDIGLWVDPESRSLFVEMAMRQNGVSGFEALLRCHDGSVLSCSLFGRFIGETGHRLLMAVYLDITERKQAETALRESEQRFSKAFSLSPAPIVISDIETGRYIDVNEQWLRMIEYTREETIGRTSHEQGIWEDPGARIRLGKRLRETGSIRDEPIRFITRSGKIKDVLWSAEKVNLGGSEVMLSLVYDISERKRAEDALQAKTEELDRFFSLALDLLCIGDIDGHFRRLNPQWQAVLGYPIEELEGARFLDLVHPEDHEATVAATTRLAHQESVLDFTNRYRCKDGSYRWIEWRSFPGGNLIYAAARDITERRQVEEALRNSLMEKESLLNEVHHRVKNNLQVISSLLHLQTRKVQNPEVHGFLRDTQNRVRSMALLHETLYRSGNLAGVSLPQYVKDVCMHVARSYASEAEDVRLQHRIADVSLDLDQAIPVGLIISELVSNAYKHAFPSPSGGEILVEVQGQPEHHVLLRVSDNGIGLPAHTDPQRIDTLGLLLVRNLSRQLEGRMTVTRGGGTLFEIVFPVHSV